MYFRFRIQAHHAADQSRGAAVAARARPACHYVGRVGPQLPDREKFTDRMAAIVLARPVRHRRRRCVALFALARRQKLRVPRPIWLRLLLVSMLTIGGWVAFMGLALLWLNASEAAVLGMSIPVWVAILAWPILGERLSPLRAVALTVALAGIAVLIGGNGIDASVEKIAGHRVRAGWRAMRRPRHRTDQAFPAGDAAAVAGRLANRARLPAGRDRWPCGRAAATGRVVIRRLGVANLYDADPVLPVHRVLVCRAREAAGDDGLDWNLAGSGRCGAGRSRGFA